MAINKQRLESALSTLNQDNMGDYCLGEFTSLLAFVRAIAFQPPQGLSTTINLNQLAKRLLIVNMDLWNIATVCHRIIWQQTLRDERRLDDELWRFYGSADVDLFFGKHRSILDNITQVIKTTTSVPRTVPQSFNDLRTWVKNPTNKRLIHDKYIKLIESCDWFNSIKNIRDSIEHDGAETVVDYDRNNVLFKVSSLGTSLTNLPEKSIINIPEITVKNDFLNLELFAGIYTGYLISFLEELAKLVYQEFGSHELDKESKNYHPGFMIIRTWIEHATKI
ncbi:MAG: hypothetical protein WAZ77_13360 [Candidatus Nitrosopolaris sp.]